MYGAVQVTTISMRRGRYAVREVAGPGDMEALRALRVEVFPADRSGPDRFDPICRHILIEEAATGLVVGGFRLLPLAGGAEIEGSYSAQHYDLCALAAIPGRTVELGRFCIRPGNADPDILRLAWAALTRIVDETGAEMLFGCTSFPGTDAAVHAEAFALLQACHIAPPRWRPRVKAPNVVTLARNMVRRVDTRRAMAAMPPLLRSYLGMGGRVSDHAVVDEEMGTLHVFTGVEIRAIPPVRRRLLRALAGSAPERH